MMSFYGAALLSVGILLVLGIFKRTTESFRIRQPVKQLTGGSCFTGCFLSYDVPKSSTLWYTLRFRFLLR